MAIGVWFTCTTALHVYYVTEKNHTYVWYAVTNSGIVGLKSWGREGAFFQQAAASL